MPKRPTTNKTKPTKKAAVTKSKRKPKTKVDKKTIKVSKKSIPKKTTPKRNKKQIQWEGVVYLFIWYVLQPIDEPSKNKGGRPIKYDIDFVLGEVRFMYQYLMLEMETITREPDSKLSIFGTYFINNLCHMRGYSRQRWSEWREKFHDLHSEDEKIREFSDTYDMVEEILEAKIGTGALTKILDGRTAQFILQNKYGYANKNENKNEETNVTLQGVLDALVDYPDVN